MLASQLATLEAPRHALTVDISPDPQSIAQQIRQSLSL
jgi:gluconate kinase